MHRVSSAVGGDVLVRVLIRGNGAIAPLDRERLTQREPIIAHRIFDMNRIRDRTGVLGLRQTDQTIGVDLKAVNVNPIDEEDGRIDEELIEPKEKEEPIND